MEFTIAPSTTQSETSTPAPAPATTPGPADEQAVLDTPNALQDAPPPGSCGPEIGPDADPCLDTGPRCPTCGTPWPPFHVRLSGLLDQALVAQEALRTLVNAVEEVLP